MATRGRARLPNSSVPGQEQGYGSPLSQRAWLLHELGKGEVPAARRGLALGTSEEGILFLLIELFLCFGFSLGASGHRLQGRNPLKSSTRFLEPVPWNSKPGYNKGLGVLLPLTRAVPELLDQQRSG